MAEIEFDKPNTNKELDKSKMIDLYYWPTPNGHKITIALEEMELDYVLKPVNIGKGDQFKPEFLAFSPNNRMPAIIDHDTPDGQPQSVFESGAILLYLAEKTGQFIPDDARGKIAVYEWLMWQMGGFGPMLGQAHHFNFYAPEKIPYAMDRYSNEANRLYGVLDRQLADHEYITGTYSIADMATFPWTHTYERQKVDIEAYPHVKRWRQLMNDRPAVKAALSAGKEMREDLAKLNKDEWSKLFGTETKDK
jgi:GST-like protein